MTERATRANGEASRRRILDAAAEIAGERGYAGTSISDVSKRSGLPKSSIYWHFADKDDLFAAVIEDSYQRWMDEFDIRAGSRELTPRQLVIHLHDSLASVPAFLRFGHLVILERHDDELTARAKFLQIRETSLRTLASIFTRATGASPRDAAAMAAVALALVDGAMLARSAGEHTLDTSAILGDAIDAYVSSLTAATSSTRRRTRERANAD
jgi:AcrR family transcriptional regulator